MKNKIKIITFILLSTTSFTVTTAANYGESAWFKFTTNLRKNNVVFTNNEMIYITPNSLFSFTGVQDSADFLKEHVVDDIKVFTRKNHMDVTNNPAYGTVIIIPTNYEFSNGTIKSIVSFKYIAPTNVPDDIALDVEMRNSYRPEKVCKFTIYIAPKHLTITFMNDEIALCNNSSSLMSYHYYYSFADHILVNDDLTLKDEGQGSNTESFYEPAKSCNDIQTVELKTANEPSAYLTLISGKLKIENDELKFYCKGHFKEHDEFNWKISVPGLTLFAQEATPGSEYDKDFTLPPAPWKSIHQPNGMFVFIPDYFVIEQMKTRQSIMIMMR
jgi:hypothetical protein